MPLFPPVLFNMVDEGVFRCGAPTSLNFEVSHDAIRKKALIFLNSLQIII